MDFWMVLLLPLSVNNYEMILETEKEMRESEQCYEKKQVNQCLSKRWFLSFYLMISPSKNGMKITEIELRLQTEIKFDNAASTEKTTCRN